MVKHHTMQPLFGRRGLVLDWVIGLIVLEVLWWLLVGYVLREVWSLGRDIAKIPIEYH
jgi:hypothetical protein